MKILNEIRDFFIDIFIIKNVSKEDEWGIMKMYLSLPFVFTLLVFIGIIPGATGRENIFAWGFYGLMTIVFIGLFIFAVIYHSRIWEVFKFKTKWN